MRNLEKDFVNKEINYNKLIDYGFRKNDNYILEKNICNNDFKVIIELSENKKTSKVIDLETNDEYVLVDVEITGNFLGQIKEEYENIINDIIINCTTPNVFKTKQAKSVIKYIKDKYNDDLEFLWEKYSKTAIWRNKQNNKWYGLLVTITEDKLGLNSSKEVEAIDIRYPKDKIEDIIDNKKIFKGYHMNKNNWITIKLDGSLDIETIYKLIDDSYDISLKK